MRGTKMITYFEKTVIGIIIALIFALIALLLYVVYSDTISTKVGTYNYHKNYCTKKCGKNSDCLHLCIMEYTAKKYRNPMILKIK